MLKNQQARTVSAGILSTVRQQFPRYYLTSRRSPLNTISMLAKAMGRTGFFRGDSSLVEAADRNNIVRNTARNTLFLKEL